MILNITLKHLAFFYLILIFDDVPNYCDKESSKYMVRVKGLRLIPKCITFFISFACPKETKQRKGYPEWFS